MIQRSTRRCEGTAMGAIVIDLRPGTGIGPFNLGMPICEAFAQIEQRPNIYDVVHVKYLDEEPLKLDIVISFPDHGFHLRFDPWSQRLRLIEVFDVKRLQMRYATSLIGGPSTLATFVAVYALFGPTFPGIYDKDRGVYTLFYPGLSFAFPIPSQYTDCCHDGEAELPLEFPDGTTPVTSRVSIYDSSSDSKVGVGSLMNKAVAPPLPGGSLYMEEVHAKMEKWVAMKHDWMQDLLELLAIKVGKLGKKVGDPLIDHNCWERPEDMDTARTVYSVEAPQTASDVAGETAAALSASSMAFRSSDPGYSETLLRNAMKAFEFADNYKGAYSDNDYVKSGACPFYCDFDGYQDELLWGAAWLRRASQNDSYLSYIQNNGKTLGADDNINEFGWDNKHAGINVLISKEFLEGNIYSLQSYKASADSFMCTLIPDSSSSHIEYTPGGLIYKPGGSNMQHVTTISFLLLVYADYLSKTSQTVNCGSVSIGASSLHQQAKKQVDYILGDNPMNMSYMVGYGNKYPQRIHHRGSSLPSIKDHPQFIGCKDGSVYYNSLNPNSNTLTGAVVGGPGEDDIYEDDRVDFRKSEPTTYINAPLVGVLAYFVANPSL